MVNCLLIDWSHLCEPMCAWDKVSPVNKDQCRHALECCLSAIYFSMGLINCSNTKCHSREHIHNIDNMCLCVINCFLEAGLEIIQLVISNAKTIPGLSVNVKHEHELLLFCHWIWAECGKPYNGTVYEIIKRGRHTYHYTIRWLMRNKINAKKYVFGDTLKV